MSTKPLLQGQMSLMIVPELESRHAKDFQSPFHMPSNLMVI